MTLLKPIPQEWISMYVAEFLGVARKLPKAGVMQRAALLRSEHAMDLVKAWRESKEGE